MMGSNYQKRIESCGIEKKLMEKKTCRGLVNVVDECNFGRTGLATLLRNALTKNSQSITWEICEASTLIDLNRPFFKKATEGGTHTINAR